MAYASVRGWLRAVQDRVKGLELGTSTTAAPTNNAALSITARLVFLYSACAFAILLASSLFLYETLTINLDHEKERFLADEITTLRQIQEVHPEIAGSLTEEIESEADPRHFLRFYVRILERGQRLLETPRMGELLPPAIFPAPVSDDPAPAQSMRYTSADGEHYLIMAALAHAGASAAPREVQIGILTSSREVIASSYRKDMAWIMILGTLLSTVAGGLIARRGMRPLRAIATRARGITASQLHERVGAAEWPAELAHLARAFDDMLERLEQSFLRLSQLSADLAHELRTPINNLMGEAEVALSRERGSVAYQRVIESSLEEFGRLSRLIDSMLFLARAEGTDSPLQLIGLEARDELDRVREFYDALAEQSGVKIRCSGAATLRADPILFRRALSNLLSNALNHTGPGGTVELRALAGGDWVDVQVADTGRGVEAQHLPRLFDRFYRADQARAGHHRGTGLGLALVRSIVDLHQGSATIESQLGLGTTVTLRFPSMTKRL